MGWFGWSTEKDTGDEVNVKMEKSSSDASHVHYIRSTDGDKADHSHVVYTKESDGSRHAHGYPSKSKR